MDRDKSGGLSAEELLAIPEFIMNPLYPRILETLGLEENVELSFTGFIQLLSLFHGKSPLEDRLVCNCSHENSIPITMHIAYYSGLCPI